MDELTNCEECCAEVGISEIWESDTFGCVCSDCRLKLIEAGKWDGE